MTTEFDTKEQALAVACAYAGVGTEALNGVIPEHHLEYSPLDLECKYPNRIEVYTIKNKNGVDATFGIGKFRDGFDLWLIADNGMMIRV